MEDNNPYAPPTANLDQNPDSGLPNATPWIRFGSAILDAVFAMLIIVPLEYFSGFIDRATENSKNGVYFSVENVGWAFLGILVWLLLNFKFLSNGQTIGKKLVKIQVQRKDGSPVGFQRYFVKRFLPVQLIALVPIAGGIVILIDALLIFRVNRNTLHDDLADTKVVQLRD